MILWGLFGVMIIEIYAAIMQREFQNTDNKVGKGFSILGIYLFVVVFYGMLNSTTWLYGAEVLPMALRSKVMGLAACSHFVVNVAVTQAGPTALANIGENYYYVFVGCTFFFLVVGYFYFPETKQKSLEEIAAAFGDKVIDLAEVDVLEQEKTRINLTSTSPAHCPSAGLAVWWSILPPGAAEPLSATTLKREYWLVPGNHPTPSFHERALWFCQVQRGPPSSPRKLCHRDSCECDCLLQKDHAAADEKWRQHWRDWIAQADFDEIIS
ncbi:hypothetical protein MCOR02_011280 [Pyricularia oryzae]|nr:hypothetical protein MCOR02_011280 [Pyricularia oryzae]KAI6289190.1 hypothetical protein MCOR34_010764 [Pyricularia oryzae]KAI6359359.1 hypothetical protein MCOR32_009285 [Pyricularia oryzae]KAI6452925.1 hypothetical protein MCOR17_009384 [Pyricularia oryzae]KAI6476713.1 hypothetical protein MCOR18_006907 [Pyricularia oryzae]